MNPIKIRIKFSDIFKEQSNGKEIISFKYTHGHLELWFVFQEIDSHHGLTQFDFDVKNIAESVDPTVPKYSRIIQDTIYQQVCFLQGWSNFKFAVAWVGGNISQFLRKFWEAHAII